MKENCKKQQRKNRQRQKLARRKRKYSKRVRVKWFCCVLKLGFFQLICKASLNFKSSLKLALSVISKQRELYESKHVAVEYRCLKIWDLLSFLICSSILVSKWRKVSPVSLQLLLAQVNLYNRKDFKLLGIGHLSVT